MFINPFKMFFFKMTFYKKLSICSTNWEINVFVWPNKIKQTLQHLSERLQQNTLHCSCTKAEWGTSWTVEVKIWIILKKDRDEQFSHISSLYALSSDNKQKMTNTTKPFLSSSLHLSPFSEFLSSADVCQSKQCNERAREKVYTLVLCPYKALHSFLPWSLFLSSSSRKIDKNEESTEESSYK